MAALSSVPFKAMLATASRFVTEDWRRWFQEVKDAIDLAAKRVGAVLALTAQAASVSGTLFTTPATGAGLYRVSWVLRVTQAATTSSSVAIAIGATVGAVLTSQSGAALTANTVGAVQSGSVVVASDASAAITYALTYASDAATEMQFAASVAVEALP
jgi:hypothetical protein